MFSLTPKSGRARSPSQTFDFNRIAALALSSSSSLVPRWLPDGRLAGAEWMARNPNRADRKIGSFSINLRTGAWADFAVGDARGGDLISLRAYLDGTSQFEAARKVAEEVAG